MPSTLLLPGICLYVKLVTIVSVSDLSFGGLAAALPVVWSIVIFQLSFVLAPGLTFLGFSVAPLTVALAFLRVVVRV